MMGCTGPFLPATWWEPSECVGCDWCENPGPLPEPDELLVIGAGIVSWRLFMDVERE